MVKDNLKVIIDYKRQGYTDQEISQLLGVAYRTMTRLINDYPELKNAFNEGKKKLIGELTDTLYRKALGKIKTKDVKRYIEEGKDGKQRVKIEETIKEYAPDTACLCFALTNLAPDRFKNSRWDVNFSELEEKLAGLKSFSEKMDEIDTNDTSQESAF